MDKSYGVGGGGGPCDFCVSPSPFGLDFGTLDLGLKITFLQQVHLHLAIGNDLDYS